MARALLNYIYPQEKGTVMDNFAGSGTLLVEASFMELDGVGVEINHQLLQPFILRTKKISA